MKIETKQIICWGVASVLQISAILGFVSIDPFSKFVASLLQVLAIAAAFLANYFGTQKKEPKPTVSATEFQGIVSQELASFYANLRLPTRKENEKHPGLSVSMVLRLRSIPAARRKYIFDIGTKERNRLSLYFDPTNTVILALLDAHGEPLVVRVPIGRTGVPMDEFIFLSCEVGVRATSTFLRVFVDGEEKANTDVPVKIDLHHFDIMGSTISADLDGKDGAFFDNVQFVAYTATLTGAEVSELLNFFRSKPTPHYLAFSAARWMRIDEKNNLSQPDPDAMPTLIKL